MKFMKNLWVLLVGILTFGVGVAQTTLPEDDPRFDTPVSIRTGPAGQPLEVLLESLARSVGLVPVFRGIPDSITVRLDVPEIPFRQAWDLLLDTYGQGLVGYRLLPNDIVLITGGTEYGARMIKLSHAKAADLVPVLQAAFGAQKTSGQVVGATTLTLDDGDTSLSTGGEYVEPSEGDKTTLSGINLVPDERTNILIAIGTSEQLDLLERVIPTLDRPEPRVQMRVRTIEVSRDLSRNLGFDWRMVGPGGLTSLEFDLLANDVPTEDGTIQIPGTGLGAVFDSTQSLTAVNFNVQVDALEAQQLVNNLNDSTATVLNNSPVSFEVSNTFFLYSDGEPVPITTGVLLTVTPRISADGQITMEVVAEKSNATAPIEGSDDPGTHTNKVDGIVRVADGGTIVLGGLIAQGSDSSESQIPILGDLPLVGDLFSAQNRVQSDQEIMFVITAEIIPD